MNKNVEFQVKIKKSEPSVYHNGAQLNLPATWAEVQDALEIARVEDGFDCQVKIVRAKRGYLDVRDNVNLFELNLLAQRLEMLDVNQSKCFEALVQIDHLNRPGQWLSLSQLINMTFSTENCSVLSNIPDDLSLGRFLYENESLTRAERTLAAAWDCDEFYELIGRMHRYENSGVFIDDRCYIEGGDIQKVYIPGEMAYFDRTGAPVVLEITNHQRENGLTAVLDLPACEQKLQRIAESVKAASIDECGYRCRDCLVPMAKDMIDNADDFEDVKEFAELLNEIERREPVVKYKALLASTGCFKLKDACELARNIDQYDFRADILSPENYGVEILRERIPELADYRFGVSTPIYGLGEMLMERHNKGMTDYGMISRLDGQALEHAADQEEHDEMEDMHL